MTLNTTLCNQSIFFAANFNIFHTLVYLLSLNKIVKQHLPYKNPKMQTFLSPVFLDFSLPLFNFTAYNAENFNALHVQFYCQYMLIVLKIINGMKFNNFNYLTVVENYQRLVRTNNLFFKLMFDAVELMRAHSAHWH